MHFVGSSVLNIHINFLDDDVIIVTSSVHRTQSICALFSLKVFYHNSQVTSDKQHRNERKTNKHNKLMLHLLVHNGLYKFINELLIFYDDPQTVTLTASQWPV